MSNEPVVLQRTSVTTVPCPTSDFITYNMNHHICAGAPIGSTGPTVGICTVDVGGPFVAENMLIGIPFFHDPRFCGRSPVSFVIF